MIETSKSQEEFRLKNGLDGRTGNRSSRTAPTARQRVTNLNDARKQWSAAGYKLVSRVERKRRYDICKSCDSLVRGQCLECGCLMRVKSLLAGMTCKLNEW